MTRLPAVERAGETLARLLPELPEALAAHTLAELEREGNPGIGAFRRAGGPRLLIPPEHGGLGARARELVHVQVALGHRAPSTAVATTMHQYTAATFVELLDASVGIEWIVVEAVATQSLLVASGFAEGDPNGRILSPSMTLTPDGPGYRLSGVKRPCSLSRSMDMITVSVRLPPPDGGFAIVLLGARTEGIVVEPLWAGPSLAGAETGIVRFDDVSVPRAALSYVAEEAELDRPQVRGYLWFELCIAASYLGIAARLVDAALERGGGDAAAVVGMASEVEACLAMLEGVAQAIDGGDAGQRLLARMLLVRLALERATQRATDLAFEALGVETLASDPALAALLAASRALSYHPPSRRRCQPGLAEHIVTGCDLVLEARR